MFDLYRMARGGLYSAATFLIVVSCATQDSVHRSEVAPLVDRGYVELNRELHERSSGEQASPEVKTELIQARSRDRDVFDSRERESSMGSENSRLDPETGDYAVSDEERRKLSNYYVAEAERRFLADDESSALKYIDYALQLNPGNPAAITLREQVHSRLGVGGNIYESRIEDDQALRSEAVAEVMRRVTKAQQLLEDESYTEAIEHADAAIDIIRWSHHLIEDDSALHAAQEVISVAKERREFQRLRDHARLKEEQRRQKELQALAQLERYNDEIRNLYDEAKRLFERREYGESVLKLDQILRRDPFNEDVIELKKIAVSLERGVRDRAAFEEFHANWNSMMASIEALSAFPLDDFTFPSHEYWEHVEQRRDNVLSEQQFLFDRADIAVRQVLESTFIDVRYSEDTTYAEIFDDLRQQASINIVTTNDVEPDLTLGAGVEINRLLLRNALNLLTRNYLEDVVWRVENGAVLFDSVNNNDSLEGETMIFNVADILLNFRTFIPEEPRLAENFDSASRWGPPETQDDPNAEAIEPVDPDILIEMIITTILPDSWDNPWPEPEVRRGELVVRHTVEGVQRVEQLLQDLRRSQGLAVSIETRFITVRQDFLQDIGIDFRGIGDSPQGANPSPVAASLDDVNFGTNNAIAGVGTGNEAGFFFQDISSANTVSEDVRGRVENLFDQAVGGARGGYGLTNSGGAAFQLAFVDNPEVNAVLRAVKKGERATTLVSPKVVVHNTQRGFVSFVNEVSYISDFNSQAVGNAAIADPIPQVIRDGIVLDVRPTISADRRYITLELRPTLATLSQPIPTITTTLSTGSPVSIQTPELQLQRLRTTVTVPDGGSFLVGGLRRMNDVQLDSGIPILSDLPLVGWLFTRKASVRTKEEIVIIVTAKLLDVEEEMFDRRGYDNG